jgi:hypothetical protein
MWFNGFMVVIDMALAELDEPLLRRHRDAIIMGAFREDVCFMPGVDLVFQNPSLSHFWPDAAQRARKFFDRALRDAAYDRQASAFVQLGRAAHPLIDMACPVHAQGVAHTTDPFEWCVEAMGDELRGLPVNLVQGAGVEDLVHGMARFAQGFAADKTTSPWGRVLRRVGLRRPVRAALAREQARMLIPRAAGCAAALFKMFLKQMSPAAGLHSAPDFELSPAGLRAWLAQLERFCQQHGGARHYQEMLDLIARCRVPS